MMTGKQTQFVTIMSRVTLAGLILLLAASGAAAQRKPRKSVVTPPPAPTVTPEELKELSDAASQSRETLIASSQTYRDSLERLLELQKQDEARAQALVEKRKQLLELGVIAKRELTESEQALAGAREKSAETIKLIEDVDNLVAEVRTAEELAKMPPPMPSEPVRSTGLLIRYVGTSRWSLGDFGKVDAFFRLSFKKPLPVSALGQTATHNHLGFDHREAIDVAVHPDSEEGQALINYLRTQGISFIAIRGAIAGSATGAHIHIGPPSRRLVVAPLTSR